MTSIKARCVVVRDLSGPIPGFPKVTSRNNHSGVVCGDRGAFWIRPGFSKRRHHDLYSGTEKTGETY